MSIPNAATQLIRQVRAHNEDAEFHTTGDPDGFGRHRTIQFDEATSKWLSPILEVLVETDKRIAEVGSKNGVTSVTFVPDIRADSRAPYEIAAIQEVIDEDKPKSKPRKKPAKKAEKKDDDQ